jgi:hypothetical protein
LTSIDGITNISNVIKYPQATPEFNEEREREERERAKSFILDFESSTRFNVGALAEGKKDRRRKVVILNSCEWETFVLFTEQFFHHHRRRRLSLKQ